MMPPARPSPSPTRSRPGRRRSRAPTRRASSPRRTWQRTCASPPSRTASPSSPATRTAASHEPEGAPGVGRDRRPRHWAVPRTHPAAASSHGELGRHRRIAAVARVRRRRRAAAAARHRVGARGVRAARQPVRRAGRGAGCGTRAAAALRHRHRHRRHLPGRVHRLDADAAAGGPGPGAPCPGRAPDAGHGGRCARGAVRALGPGDPHRRVASAGGPADRGSGRGKGRGGGTSEAGGGEAAAQAEARSTPRPSPFPESTETEDAAVGPTGLCTGRRPDSSHRSPDPRPARRRRRRARADRADGPEADRDAADVSGRGAIAGRTVGPVVTQYEVAPGPGVKVGRIAGLADDLALAMRAQSLRIVAPIPGKAAVGIEVPNPMPRMVHIRELIEGEDYHRTNRVLPVALGKNLEGEPVVADLTKMPHLLIAGVTGSGKSVCINTIITSLIYTHPPERLKLLMVDPKMVELSMYGALPHLGHDVVTSNRRAASALNWAVKEMERRYRLLHANHARNIADFNRKVEQKKSKSLKGPSEVPAAPAGPQKELPLDA